MLVPERAQPTTKTIGIDCGATHWRMRAIQVGDESSSLTVPNLRLRREASARAAARPSKPGGPAARDRAGRAGSGAHRLLHHLERAPDHAALPDQEQAAGE